MALKEYKKLNKFEEYDQEAAEELAEALTEIHELGKRVNQLQELVNENPELHTFVWTTADGKSIAIHKIEDDHFKNILQHLVNNGRSIGRSLRAEARRRGIEIPDGYASISLSRRNLIEGDIVDDGDIIPDVRYEVS
jgi:hypothetical protein